jgi:HK97 family phage prohead protease
MIPSIFNCTLQEIKLAPSSDDAKVGTLEGYGSVFNNVDQGWDVVQKGAFKKSLSDWGTRGKLPKMLLQHGGGWSGTAEDGIPIGKWTQMKEDDHGLYVKGELFALNTQKGQYIYEGLKSGELDGLSIGYIPIGMKYGDGKKEPERTLTEVKLLEVSVVTFPMNEQATVDSVKSAIFGKLAQLSSFQDMEGFLRALGCSQRQAKTAISQFKKICLNQSDSGGQPQEDDPQLRDALAGLSNRIALLT